MLDFIILGAGPIGMACGIECEKNNLNYLIVEKGCLVNSIYNFPKNMTFFSTSEKLEIGNVPFISHNNKPTRTEALEYYRRVAQHWNLKINLYEEVFEITKKENSFVIKSNKNSYKCKAVIVSTGYYSIPSLIGVKGENLPKVKHYYDEPHLYFKQKVLVVGSANSAVDVALETYRKGAEVTMVVREKSISDRVKYWVKPDIENRLELGEIKSYFNSEVLEIKPNKVIIKTPSGKETIENNFVLAMTGYSPNFNFLEKIGIKTEKNNTKTPVYNEQTNQSNIKNIYLAGVICGGNITNKWFIENSRAHAVNIINNYKKNIS